MPLSIKKKAELWLVLATLIWGGTFAVIKLGLNDASPFMFLALRFFAAFLALFIFFPKIFKELDKRTLKRGLLLGFLMFGGYGLQVLGLKYTTVAKSSLITYSFVLIIPFLQYFISKKSINTGNIIGIGIVSFGMFLLNNPDSSSFNIGDFITFGSAVFYAFYLIGLDCLTANKTWLLTALQFLVTAFLGIIFSLLFEETYINPTISLANCLFFLAIPGGVGAIFILTNFQKETTPVKASLIYSLEPVFAIFFGFVILNQGLNLIEFIGVLIILTGVILSEFWNNYKLSKMKV